MSGGSMRYLYRDVEQIGRELQEKPEAWKRAFGNHLVNVSVCLHDIEWAQDGDMCDDEAMQTVLKLLDPQDLLDTLVKDARSVIMELQTILEEVEE